MVWRGVVLAGAVVTAGCGRIGFSPTTSGDGGGSADPDSGPRGSVVRTFGDRSDVDVPGTARDTWLDMFEVDFNYGTTADLQADASETPLLRFALSATIPPTAQIVSARFFITTTDNNSPSGVASLYPLFESWDEGIGDGTTGAASWNERTAGGAWSGAGASPPSSGLTALGTFMPNDSQTQYVVDVGVETVQSWVDGNDTTNFGFVIRMDSGNGADFHSSEAIDESQRPMLEISYNL